MQLLALGLNHDTAPVEIREKVAFSPNHIHQALQSLKAKGLADEGVILSTCNRTELYLHHQSDAKAIQQWLHEFFQLDAQLHHHLYVHHQDEAVKHLMRVAAGLDSLVLGEPQILGQVKDAFEMAKKGQGVGRLMNSLFQSTFRAAKQVRTDTAIGANPVSVAFAAVHMAKMVFDDFSELTALMIGAGETIELVCQHLSEHKIGRLIIANRTLSNAHALGERFGGFAIELTEIRAHLHQADLIIASTASPMAVLGKGMAESAMNKRKHKPQVMIDIAVPRDIEPEVGDLEDVYLYSVDDLKSIIDENKKSRQEAATKAEDIIRQHVEHFTTHYQATQEAGPLIAQYRQHAEDIKQEALQHALAELRHKNPEEVLQKLANQLTHKLIHQPTLAMRQAAEQGDHQLLKAAAEILSIHP